MSLTQRDVAFLTEFIEVSWANHYVASRALYHAGQDPTKIAEEWAANENNPANQQFLGVQHDPSTVEVRIQKLAALRMWQEYLAAFEDAAAFLLAIRRRDEGILQRVFAYHVEEIEDFYEQASDHTVGLDALLNLPTKLVLRSPWEWCRERLREAAEDYNNRLERAAGPLDMMKNTETSDVFVMVRVNREGSPPAQAKGPAGRGMLASMKHGFRATANHRFYTTRDASGIWVVRLGTTNDEIHILAHNLDVIGRVCQHVARAVLELEGPDSGRPS